MIIRSDTGQYPNTALLMFLFMMIPTPLVAGKDNEFVGGREGRGREGGRERVGERGWGEDGGRVRG